MQIQFLGAGAAFVKPRLGNWQSNMIITADSGKRMLIDCGTQVHMAMDSYDMSIFDIDAIYISHLHADHIGGMEEAAFTTYFTPDTPKPNLILNGKLAGELWNNSLCGGLGSLQGQLATLETYFDVTKIRKNETFEWEGIEFRLVQVIHYMDGYEIVPSYGLMWDVNGKRYFLTTDAQHAPSQIQDMYNQADVIFQDCETTPYKSGVHAHYTELVELDAKTKAKMRLYHYADGELPDAKKDGFHSFVKPGQVFKF